MRGGRDSGGTLLSNPSLLDLENNALLKKPIDTTENLFPKPKTIYDKRQTSLPNPNTAKNTFDYPKPQFQNARKKSLRAVSKLREHENTQALKSLKSLEEMEEYTKNNDGTFSDPKTVKSLIEKLQNLQTSMKGMLHKAYRFNRVVPETTTLKSLRAEKFDADTYELIGLHLRHTKDKSSWIKPKEDEYPTSRALEIAPKIHYDHLGNEAIDPDTHEPVTVYMYTFDLI